MRSTEKTPKGFLRRWKQRRSFCAVLCARKIGWGLISSPFACTLDGRLAGQVPFFVFFFASVSTCLLLVQVSRNFLSCGRYVRLLYRKCVVIFFGYNMFHCIERHEAMKHDFKNAAPNFKSEAGSWSSAQDVSSIRSGLPRVSCCQMRWRMLVMILWKVFILDPPSTLVFILNPVWSPHWWPN